MKAIATTIGMVIATLTLASGVSADVPDAQEQLACLDVTVAELQEHPASGVTTLWTERTDSGCCIVHHLVLVSLEPNSSGNYWYWYQAFGSANRDICQL